MRRSPLRGKIRRSNGAMKGENMPQSLAKVHLHIVFSTKNREALIGRDVQKELYSYIASICQEVRCRADKIQGTKDHVHIACCLSRTITYDERYVWD